MYIPMHYIIFFYVDTCMVLGCTPFEVFYGRVSNSEFHPMLTVVSDMSESNSESISVSLACYIFSNRH